MEPFIGLIVPWPLDYAPQGWVFCDGRLLSVAQNQALFALLRNTYGGDGRTTFAVPDLRGRFPVGINGQPGTIPAAKLGATGGSPTANLPLPAHQHGVSSVQAKSVLKVGTSAAGTQTTPTPGSCLVVSPAGGSTAAQIYQTTAPTTTVDVAGVSTSVTGSTDIAGGDSTTVNVLNPYLGLNFIIATQGIFPTRS